MTAFFTCLDICHEHFQNSNADGGITPACILPIKVQKPLPQNSANLQSRTLRMI
jgi:hypothetical protein